MLIKCFSADTILWSFRGKIFITWRSVVRWSFQRIIHFLDCNYRFGKSGRGFQQVGMANCWIYMCLLLVDEICLFVGGFSSLDLLPDGRLRWNFLLVGLLMLWLKICHMLYISTLRYCLRKKHAQSLEDLSDLLYHIILVGDGLVLGGVGLVIGSAGSGVHLTSGGRGGRREEEIEGKD